MRCMVFQRRDELLDLGRDSLLEHCLAKVDPWHLGFVRPGVPNTRQHCSTELHDAFESSFIEPNIAAKGSADKICFAFEGDFTETCSPDEVCVVEPDNCIEGGCNKPCII